MNALKQHIAKDGFRLRGTEMSRIDAFSDVVFGFALTLIVVSLEVPKTFEELFEGTRGFIPFFICFVFLILLWYEHFRFFRRYNLHDPRTIALNAALLFTLLFYIYPLKFLFTMLTGEILRISAMVPHFESYHQLRELMLLYAVGFAAIYGLFSLLYANALSRKSELDLNERERFITFAGMVDNACMACVGLLSALLSQTLPDHHIGSAGFAYLLIGPVKAIHGSWVGRRLRSLPLTEAQTEHPTVP